jgi:7-carboxy-7-deazaguanine synthase
MSDRGNLLEIFSSYQGEGVQVGVRQVFVRLSICHLRCAYCDTPQSWTEAAAWREEIEPLSRRFETRPNPASVEQVARAVERHASGAQSVSVTGGEPLVQVKFLEALLPRLPLPVYLETSGTMGDRLARIAGRVDFFSLDFKPPSTPGVRLDWDDFEACVRIAAGRPAQVKVVVMADSPLPEEVERAASIMRRLDPSMPLVFTPVTEVNEASRAASAERMAELHARAAGLDVHVIPQLHPLVGWL